MNVGNRVGVLSSVPHVRQPLIELAHGRRREVGQKLREIKLRIDRHAAGRCW